MSAHQLTPDDMTADATYVEMMGDYCQSSADHATRVRRRLDRWRAEMVAYGARTLDGLPAAVLEDIFGPDWRGVMKTAVVIPGETRPFAEIELMERRYFHREWFPLDRADELAAHIEAYFPDLPGRSDFERGRDAGRLSALRWAIGWEWSEAEAFGSWRRPT